jgi:hypothetical protein
MLMLITIPLCIAIGILVAVLGIGLILGGIETLTKKDEENK